MAPCSFPLASVYVENHFAKLNGKYPIIEKQLPDVPSPKEVSLFDKQ